MSFIPLIGIPFGLVAILWGLVRRTWIIAGMGLGGILTSVVLYSSLFYFGFVQRGGIYDHLREQIAVTMLNRAVKDIEFYKQRHGHYPDKLSELEPKDANNRVFVIDPTVMQRPGHQSPTFFYELAADGQTYLLRSVGADGLPYTDDDILPTLSEGERKGTGLRLHR